MHTNDQTSRTRDLSFSVNVSFVECHPVCPGTNIAHVCTSYKNLIVSQLNMKSSSLIKLNFHVWNWKGIFLLNTVSQHVTSVTSLCPLLWIRLKPLTLRMHPRPCLFHQCWFTSNTRWGEVFYYQLTICLTWLSINACCCSFVAYLHFSLFCLLK